MKIIEILKQLEAGRNFSELSLEYGVSTASIYAWKSRYAGLEVNELKPLKELEEENRRLKTLVANLSLDKVALKAVIEKTAGAAGSATRRRAVPRQTASDERTARLPAAGLDHSNCRYRPKPKLDEELCARPRELAAQHPRYGYQHT